VTTFSFDGSFSLLIFYVYRKKEKQSIDQKFEFLFKIEFRSFNFSSSFICAAVSNAS